MAQQQAANGFEVRPTAKFVILAYAVVALLTVIAAFLALKYQARREVWYAIVGGDVLLSFWIVMRQLKLQFTRLTLEQDKLRFEEGFLTKSTRMLNASKIQDVNVDQGVTDRLLGIGTITLQTAGEAGRLVMQNIDQPRQVADRILSIARQLPKT